MSPAQIDRFVGMVVPVAQKFEPIARPTAPSSALETLSFITGRSTLETGNARLTELADQRVQAIIEPINNFYSGRHDLGIIAPPLKGRVFDQSESSATKGATMFFDSREGVVGAQVPDMLRMPPDDREHMVRQLERLPDLITTAELTGRFKHEARHGMQVYDVARIVAERLNLDKGRILERSNLYRFQESIGETLRPGTGTETSFEYLGRLIKTWLHDERTITAQDRERVDGLISGFNTENVPGQNFRDASSKIKFANGVLHRIDNGVETDALVKGLTYHRARINTLETKPACRKRLEGIVQPGASLVGAR